MPNPENNVPPKSDMQTSRSRAPLQLIRTSLFMNIVETINKATTLESLFTSAMQSAPVTCASYHHLPSIGAFDYHTLGRRYFGYNLPKPIEDHYKSYKPDQNDPGLVTIFTKGEAMWLSDLAADPSLTEAKWGNRAEQAMKLMGDGLCLPLFGPNNRHGYMFLTAGFRKKDVSPYICHQVQALGQHFHLRFCFMVQKLHNQIQLTDRQAEVLELVAFGKTNHEIAKILNISTSTVSGYMKLIFLKLGVSDRVSASMRAQSMKVMF